VTVQHSSDYITICEFEISGEAPATPDDAAGLITPESATSQSTEGWSGAASRAVDGSTETSWGEASCTHTQNGDPEWWQVALGASFNVWDFNLYHRTDCCQDRLIGANIIVSDTEDYTDGGVMCSASIYGGNEAQPEIGNCYGAVGQFITVQHSNDYITICEFEALGVPR